MDGEAWWATVHGVTKSRTRLSDFTFFHFHCSSMAQWVKNLPERQETQEMWVQSLGGKDPLEKEMATHSSTHAWKIPWMEKPGGLQSMGSQRVGQY